MKLTDKQKDPLYKIFFFTVIQLLLLTFHLIISAISGDFVWTVERLTSSLAGSIIQILELVILIDGIIIALYIVIFLFLMIIN